MKDLLLVIDMLNDFVHPHGVLNFQEGQDIIPFVKARIDHFRIQRSQLHNDDNFYIAYICDAHEKDDKEFDRFPPHAIRGTWGSEIVDTLKPERTASYNEVMVLKQRYSGFYGTGLDKLIRQENIRNCEVVGVCTSICVMDTVGGLANRDLDITIPLKGIADFNPEAHKFAIERMKSLYGAKII